MSRSPVPKMRGVEAFMSDTSKIDQLESIALNTPPQYIDPRLLVRSPYQPRTSFLADEMDELERSIAAAGGVKVPLIVRPGINEIIAGERRSIIAISRGDLLVPVFWHTCSDEEAAELAGFENVKRADLNAVDETNLVINMLKMRLKLPDRQAAIDLIQRANYQNRSDSHNNVVTSDQIAIVEKTIADFTKGSLSLLSFCSHKLKLLNLPTEIVEAIRTNQIEYTKAAEIGKIEDEAARSALLNRTVEEGLSVAQVKEEVAKTKPPKTPKAAKQQKSAAVEDSNIDLEEDFTSIEDHVYTQTSNVQLEQSQPDLTSEASQISTTSQEEIDEKIQEMAETIRFKISNDAYSLEAKQEVEKLLVRVMKILD